MLPEGRCAREVFGGSGRRAESASRWRGPAWPSDRAGSEPDAPPGGRSKEAKSRHAERLRSFWRLRFSKEQLYGNGNWRRRRAEIGYQYDADDRCVAGLDHHLYGDHALDAEGPGSAGAAASAPEFETESGG